MTYTIDQLKSKLTPKENLEDTWRYPNCYYAEANGKVIGLNYTQQEDITALVLNDEASDLQFLYLSYNKNLQQVDIQVSLPQLTHLYLNNCNIRHFELSISCPALKHLYLEQQGFAEKKYDNKDTGKLETLQINGRNCPNLWFLELSNNNLKRLQFEGTFPELAYIYAGFNGMETLIMPYQSVPKLNILDLQENGLRELPNNSYANLEALYVKGNPLLKYEEKLIKGDSGGNATELIALLRAAATSGESINHRVKLIIVGNGRVGKTCLVKRLNNLACEGNELYTHGIALSTIDKSYFPDVKTDELELKIWDFGGQEVYYATHQFFLTEEAAYIYAWTDEQIAKNNLEKDRQIAKNNLEKDRQIAPILKEDRWRSHSYWLDNIRMHSKESPLLVVKTHCDNFEGVFPYDSLKDDYMLNISPFDFDAKGDEGQLNRLKRKITSMINALLGKTIPNSYNAIIEAIEAKKNAPNNETEISRTELRNLAIGEEIDEKDFDSLLKYLKDTAGVIHYFDKAELKERIFINPDDLIAQVYKLIENNTDLVNSEGVFDEKYALEKIGKAQWEILLPLLLDFELIYKKQSEKEITYIAPQYLPLLPSFGNAFKSFQGNKSGKALRFTLKYPRFIPENIMVNVLSEYGPYVKDSDAVYLDGIHFTKEKTSESCVIECDRDKREIKVYTSVNSEANLIAREVFGKFIELSKKAEVHISCDGGEEWAFCKGLDSLQKSNDIPKVDGGIIKDKSNFGFLFENSRNISNMQENIDENKVYESMIEVKMSEGARGFVPFKEIEETIKILMVSANPDGTDWLRIDKEGKKTKFEQLLSNKRERFEIIPIQAATTRDMHRAIVEHEPHIIHFSGHAESQKILLEDKEINTSQLKRLILLSKKVQLVFINACNSASHAMEIAKEIPYVIGHHRKILDLSAIEFAEGLYLSLFNFKSIEDAVESGRISIDLAGLPDEDVPVLIKGVK